MKEIQGVWKDTVKKKILFANERKDIEKLCKISYVIWKQNVMFKRK